MRQMTRTLLIALSIVFAGMFVSTGRAVVVTAQQPPAAAQPAAPARE